MNRPGKLKFSVIELLFDKFILLENFLDDPKTIPTFLRASVLPKDLNWHEHARKKRSQCFNNPFIRNMGPITFTEELEASLNNLPHLTGKIPTLLATGAYIPLRGWNVRPAEKQTFLKGVQSSLEPFVEILPFGVFRICLRLRLHMPRGIPVDRLIQLILAFSPNPPSSLKSEIVRLNMTRNGVDYSCSVAQVFENISEALQRECVGTCSQPKVTHSSFRSGIWIEKVRPWPSLVFHASELRALLLQDVRWKEVNKIELEKYQKSAWGIYDPDAVLFGRSRALWSFRKPRIKHKRVWLYSAMMGPWRLIGAQDVLFAFYKRKLEEIYMEVFMARRTLRSMTKHAFTIRFFRPEFIFALDKAAQTQTHMAGPERRCYHALAEHYNMPARESDLRNRVRDLVNEADQWKIPLAAPMARAFSWAKKFVQVE